MPNSKYISLILFLIILVTMINLYFKPNLTDKNNAIQWFESVVDPISKSICPLQGFKCPSNEQCDCKKFCSNGSEFEAFNVVNRDERIYVMNKKLTPGTYCLPKGADRCNLKANYHLFSLAGWSCLPLNEVVFKGDKKRACKNEEAENNDLNVLWDHLKNEEAGDNIEDYYEWRDGRLRYRCNCGSKSMDGTPMISVFPFVCSIDYCLRDIDDPLPFMGWNGKKCECGPYFHSDPNDETSPCRRELSRIENDTFIGRVDCMSENSFEYKKLFCPTADKGMIFKEWVKTDSTNVLELVDKFVKNKQ